MLAYLAALGAAAFFAIATALQHLAAATGASISGTAQSAGRALGGLFSRPLWLVGLAADAVGFALHAFALTAGRLVIVQPLLVTSLLFALPMASRLQGRPIGRAELRWAAVTVASLGGFLALARPSGGGSTPELGPSAVSALAALALVLVILVAGRGTAARHAASLGAITGLAYGATAALIKAVGNSFGSDVSAVFTRWPLYVLLVIGPAGFVINQIAFQAGPLSASLPAISAVDPLASIVLGILLYDERLHGGAWSAIGQGSALILLAFAVIRLAAAEQCTPPGDAGGATPAPANH